MKKEDKVCHSMKTIPEAFEPQRHRYKFTIGVCLAVKGCAQVLQPLGGEALFRTQGHCPCDVLSEMNTDRNQR